MRRILATAVVAMLAACSDGGPVGERYFAYMSGTTAVPPNASSGSGTTTLAFDGAGFEFSVAVQQIVNVTAVRVHAGEAGVVGAPLADLFTGPATGPIIDVTVIASGYLAAGDLAVTPDSLAALMRAGKAYVNVVTSGVPGGEIRGQLGLQ